MGNMVKLYCMANFQYKIRNIYLALNLYIFKERKVKSVNIRKK